MKINRRWLASGATAVALGAVVTGTALAQNDAAPATTAEADDAAEDEAEGEDVPITGDALEQAKAAALAHTEGGTVTDTEVGDEESYYEVEVTLDNGQQVDVQLDEQFNVVGDEVEDEGDDD